MFFSQIVLIRHALFILIIRHALFILIIRHPLTRISKFKYALMMSTNSSTLLIMLMILILQHAQDLVHIEVFSLLDRPEMSKSLSHFHTLSGNFLVFHLKLVKPKLQLMQLPRLPVQLFYLFSQLQYLFIFLLQQILEILSCLQTALIVQTKRPFKFLCLLFALSELYLFQPNLLKQVISLFYLSFN